MPFLVMHIKQVGIKSILLNIKLPVLYFVTLKAEAITVDPFGSQLRGCCSLYSKAPQSKLIKVLK